MLKVNNKDTRTASVTSFWRLFFVKFEQISLNVEVFSLLTFNT